MGNKNSVQGQDAIKEKRLDWMSRLPPEKKSVPISRISILGSHDSFTYSLKQSFPVGPDEPVWMRTVAKITGKLAKSIISRWGRCQSYNCQEQLSLGVRYFDIRLAKLETKSEESLRVVHGLFGDKIEDILKTINEFLDNYPGEIIILDFQHLYQFSELDHLELISLLKITFGPEKLCPCPSREQTPSLNYMIKNGLRVIIVYPAEAGKLNVDFLWPRTFCPNPWPNTTRMDVLQTFLNQGLNVRNPDLLYVSQGVLTPQLQTVLLNFLSSLQTFVRKQCNGYLKNWVTSSETLHKNPNIIMCDFPELYDVGSSVIDLNFK